MRSNSELLQADKYTERYEEEMRRKWQDLPDELILKVLSYSEVKDLISCGQLSKRIRKISQDRSLWVTANLEKKIVKTELLEMILLKGCKILNLSNSTIVGHLSSSIKSQLRVLDLSQSAWGFPAKVYHEERIEVLEELLFSCGSLQHLQMEGLLITAKMAFSICKNGKTLQVLNLKNAYVDKTRRPSDCLHYYLDYLNIAVYELDYTVPNRNFPVIIKYCQELKEVNLSFINEEGNLSRDDLEFLAKNISPNVEKLNLSYLNFNDYHAKILLSRCNKIKVLILDVTLISTVSLKTIKQYLNLTLEELSVVDFDDIDYKDFLDLKSMPRLNMLKLKWGHRRYDDIVEIQNLNHLRQLLPHIKILGCTEFDL